MDKRNLGRFCIQFNILDDRHQQVIEILDEKGRRKAQFIAEAILHYVNCPENADVQNIGNRISIKKMIEVSIIEFFKNENPQIAVKNGSDSVFLNKPSDINPDLPELTEMVDDDLLNSMRESLASFRENSNDF